MTIYVPDPVAELSGRHFLPSVVDDLKDFDRIRTPWEHQERALRQAYYKNEFALFFEPGTGKSLTSILIARSWMHREKKGMRILVVSPLITLENWRDEWLMGSKLQRPSIGIAEGPKRDNVFCDPNIIVAITGYETMRMESSVKCILRYYRPKIVIFDESHRVKNAASKQAKGAFAVAKEATHRLILTGTPILNSAMDLFMQYKILDLGKTFGTNFLVFRNTYFYDKNAHIPRYRHWPDWAMRTTGIDTINGKIASSSMFVKKEECLDLPPLVKRKVPVDLNNEQADLYLQMSRDLIATVDQGVATAELVLTKLLRLLQILCGFVPLEGTDENYILSKAANPRDIALHEILEDVLPTGKVIIWSTFKQSYESIRKVLRRFNNLQWVELHGEIPQDEKFANIRRFNFDPEVKVCIGHPGSGGIGVNLTAANHMIFYNRMWNLEYDIQAESRNYRGGSEIHTKITRWDIFAPNTIDEEIMQILVNKMELSDKILTDRMYHAVHDSVARFAATRGKEISAKRKSEALDEKLKADIKMDRFIEEMEDEG